MMMTETGQYPPFPVPRVCPFREIAEQAGMPQLPPGREAVSRVTLPDGAAGWLITGHECVQRILTDPRASSSRSNPGFPQLRRTSTRELPKSTPPIIGLDPPAHTVHRRMLINEFTVRRLRALRPRIQQIVDTCIDDLLDAGPEADLVEALAVPVPSLVICELLGVPKQDRPYFQERTKLLLDPNTSAEDARAPLVELVGYIDKLILGKEAEPGDDMLGRLIVRYREAGLYEHHFIVKTAALLLNAGHETTSNMISLSVLALLRHPGQLERLLADPARMPVAVEELLRFFSVVDHTMARVAVADIELGGKTIKAGEGLVALPSTANRDPDVFQNPDELDLERNEVRKHLAFGYGNHQCLGQNLARIELEVVLSTLFARVPGLRLAVPLTGLCFKDEAQIYGVHELPVAW